MKFEQCQENLVQEFQGYSRLETGIADVLEISEKRTPLEGWIKVLALPFP